MANARLVTPKPVKQPPKRIILELSEGEADFILGITAHIGGSETLSPRKYSARIRVALRNCLGYDFDESDAYRLCNPQYSCGLEFYDYPTRKADR